METPVSLIESLVEKIEVFGKTTFELSKLKLVETTTQVVTSAISRLGVIIMFSMFILILSIGIALLLGDLLGKFYYGFFIMAAFYLLAGIVFHFSLRKWIKKPISDSIIKQVFQ